MTAAEKLEHASYCKYPDGDASCPRCIADLKAAIAAEPQGEPVAWIVNDENGQFITIVRSIVDKEFYERCRGVTSPLYSIPDPRIAALEAALAAAQAKIAGNAALMAKLVEDAAILLNERDEARAALKEAVARAVIAVKGGE